MLFFDAGGARDVTRKQGTGVSPSVARDGLHGVTGKRHVRHDAERGRSRQKPQIAAQKLDTFQAHAVCMKAT